MQLAVPDAMAGFSPADSPIAANGANGHAAAAAPAAEPIPAPAVPPAAAAASAGSAAAPAAVAAPCVATAALAKLCTPELASLLPAAPLHLAPRGIVNTGNSCFVNATMQAMLGCPPFVAFLDLLKAAAPLLAAADSPVLQSLAALAAEFSPAAPEEPPTPAEAASRDGWAETPKGGKRAASAAKARFASCLAPSAAGSL